VTLPCYEWQHVLVLPKGPPAGREGTRHAGGPGARADHHLPPVLHRPHAHRHAFAQKKLQPRIALEAIDSDVIKTYVRLGLGIGIVAEMAVRDDGTNATWSCAHGPLFGQNIARVAFKRSAYLRNFVFRSPSCCRTARPQPDRQGHERPATTTNSEHLI
jgi:LysR family cys regulon transcriptional activator